MSWLDMKQQQAKQEENSTRAQKENIMPVNKCMKSY